MRSHSMRRTEEAASALLGLILITLLKCVGFALTGLVCSIFLRYTVNHWLIYCERPPVFPYIIGFLIGVIPFYRGKLAGLSVLSAVCTYITLLFL